MVQQQHALLQSSGAGKNLDLRAAIDTLEKVSCRLKQCLTAVSNITQGIIIFNVSKMNTNIRKKPSIIDENFKSVGHR